MMTALHTRPNGRVAGNVKASEDSINNLYREIVGEEPPPGPPIGWFKVGDRFLEPVSWELIYNTIDSTATTDGGWYRTMNTGTSAAVTVKAKLQFDSDWTDNHAIFAKVRGTCGDTEWIRLNNGWDRLGTPCATACDEWAIVGGTSTHACTLEYRWGMIDEAGWIHAKPLSPEEQEAQRQRKFQRRFREIIEGRCAPNIIIRNNDRRKPLPMPADIREQRARETLRRVIGEQKFRNFVRTGFVSVRAKSGLVYQIFPGHGITCVFDQGQLVDRLCVVLQGNFPPTDSLIMRYLMILNNEQQFRSYAIKHTPRAEVLTIGEADMRPLAEIFKELKQKVA